MVAFKRGDVVIARLPDLGGAEKFGTRPCVVVQNDDGNSEPGWYLTIVVPVTGRSVRYPFDVEIRSPEGNLDRDSVADCSQIMVVDKVKVIKVIGQVSPVTMVAIEKAIKGTFDLS